MSTATAQPAASPAQLRFITNLANERVLSPMQQRRVAEAPTQPNWREIRKLIDDLKAAPLKEAAATERTVKYNVPDGRYAIKGRDGGVRFFKLNTGKSDRWKGFRFLDEQHGDNFAPIKDRELKAKILAFVQKAPLDCATLYGKELGVCGICGKKLTDDASRAMGIGPDCFEKITGRRRTREEERAAINAAQLTPVPQDNYQPPQPQTTDPAVEQEQAEAHHAAMQDQRAAILEDAHEAQAAGNDRLAMQLAKVRRALDAGNGLTLVVDGIFDDENLEGIHGKVVDYARAEAYLRSESESTISRNEFGF